MCGSLPDPPADLLGKHIFTFPKDEDIKAIQMIIIPDFTICVSVRRMSACLAKAKVPEEWNHFAVTLKESNGAVEARIFINGKFMGEKTISTVALTAAGSNPLTGFVLGQDSDNGVINDIRQSFYGIITKLHLYGRLLNE